MKQEIAILILFFNKLQETLECVNSFLPSGQELYILNNASDPTLWKILKQQYHNKPQVHFIHSDINLGPAKGRNLLINTTKEDWIFLVDNDITVLPEQEWVGLFQEFIASHPSAEVICPRLFNVHENEYGEHAIFVFNNGTISLQDKAGRKGNYFPSGASIVRRSLFERGGLFEEGLFAFEDYEYAIRMLVSGKGLEVETIPGIKLRHDHRVQNNKRDKSAVKARYNDAKLRASFELMQKKHGIVFDHDWEWWSRQQLKKMVGVGFFNKWKRRLKRLLPI